MHPTEAKLHAALEACRSHLTEEEFREVFDLYDRHGEWGVAVEALADILLEKEAKVSASQLELIESAFVTMDLNPDGRTASLRGLVAHDSS